MQITADRPSRVSIVSPASSRSLSTLMTRTSQFVRQQTIRQPITCVGVGLHSGAAVRMTLNPAEPGHGIQFLRTDHPASQPILARFDHVVDTRLSTVIARADAPDLRVATIEHLMAALHANGIDNVLVGIDGPETPVLDGSAAEFDFLLQCAGTDEQDVPRQMIEVLQPVRVEDDQGAYAELRPARSGFSLAMSIDFRADAIGRQQHAMQLTANRFRHEVAYCRTFVERQEIETLQKMGLARGGSLDNAIVVDGAGILNPCGLRHPKEFVRHKLMDAVGDLYLAGHTLQAGFMGHKSGHGLNNRVLRALFASGENWRLVPCTADGTATIPLVS